MLTQQFAAHFANHWIESWNSHDIDRILSHYTDDFEMSSPLIAQVTGETTGVLKGKEAIGAYWSKALQRFPDLKFELEGVFVGAVSVVLTYTNVSRGVKAAELFYFNEAGLVYRAAGNYSA
ncbi:MAG TPA: nuclear transport factor 2 family protein [Chitinophagales bacterium]|nr:nuclear transport factor 2 family protein [Chitinophagales bacterium]